MRTATLIDAYLTGARDLRLAIFDIIAINGSLGRSRASGVPLKSSAILPTPSQVSPTGSRAC